MRKVATGLFWIVALLFAALSLSAPLFGLKLSEVVIVDLFLGAPILGFLLFLRWVLRPRPAAEKR